MTDEEEKKKKKREESWLLELFANVMRECARQMMNHIFDEWLGWNKTFSYYEWDEGTVDLDSIEEWNLEEFGGWL